MLYQVLHNNLKKTQQDMLVSVMISINNDIEVIFVHEIKEESPILAVGHKATTLAELSKKRFISISEPLNEELQKESVWIALKSFMGVETICVDKEWLPLKANLIKLVKQTLQGKKVILTVNGKIYKVGKDIGYGEFLMAALGVLAFGATKVEFIDK